MASKNLNQKMVKVFLFSYTTNLAASAPAKDL